MTEERSLSQGIRVRTSGLVNLECFMVNRSQRSIGQEVVKFIPEGLKVIRPRRSLSHVIQVIPEGLKVIRSGWCL